MRTRDAILASVAFLVLGLFIGYLLWGPTWEVPRELKYDIFKDTLIIVLTVATVFIAVVGVVVYGMVTQRITTRIEKRITDESRRWVTRLATHTGYSFWEAGHKKEAIDLTRITHDEYSSKLPEKEPENELLIAEIRNNLACFYAEQKDKKNKDLAKGYAAYIHSISHKYPEQRETWERTYHEVAEAFPE